jgi:hypothetical protein
VTNQVELHRENRKNGSGIQQLSGNDKQFAQRKGLLQAGDLLGGDAFERVLFFG